MRRSGFLLVLLLTAAMQAAACASSQTGSSKPAKIPSARMTSRASLDVSSPGNRNITPFDVKFEVMIRPDGSPDMETFKISGAGASQVKTIVAEWITASMFEPSKVNGVPVTSKYQGGVKAMRR